MGSNDLHSATTKNAFPDLEERIDELKNHRKLGKRDNLLRVYEDGVDALMNALGVSREVSEDLDKAFYKSFPRIICADMVIKFEIKVLKHLTKNKLKSRLVLPIHDELMASVAKDVCYRGN